MSKDHHPLSQPWHCFRALLKCLLTLFSYGKRHLRIPYSNAMQPTILILPFRHNHGTRFHEIRRTLSQTWLVRQCFELQDFERVKNREREEENSYTCTQTTYYQASHNHTITIVYLRVQLVAQAAGLPVSGPM